MKEVNLVVIGIPTTVSRESIAKATAIMAKSLKLENVHVEILEMKDFKISPYDRDILIGIINDIVTVCTAAGLSNIAAINANFWRLVGDGKLTKSQIQMLLDEKETTLRHLNQKGCSYIFTLLEQAIRLI